MKYKLLLLLSITGLLMLFSCSEDDLNKLEEEFSCDTLNISYSQHVAPIIEQNCNFSGCHSAATNNIFDASDFNSISASADNIYDAVFNARMPKGAGKLPDCEIAQIKKWIDEGKPNN